MMWKKLSPQLVIHVTCGLACLNSSAVLVSSNTDPTTIYSPSSAVLQYSKQPLIQILFIYLFILTPQPIVLLNLCGERQTLHPKEKLFYPFAFLWNEIKMKSNWRKVLLKGWGEQKKIQLYCLDQDISMWDPVSHRLQKQTKTTPFEPLAMWLAP